jgi:hypothetical protein
LATATLTGMEFATASASRVADYGRATYSLAVVYPPVTSYSLTPAEAVAATETSSSIPDGSFRGGPAGSALSCS